jgi:ClpP class serine protease
VLSQRDTPLTQLGFGTSYARFAVAFQKAVADPAVDAIVIDIHSPGGVHTV